MSRGHLAYGNKDFPVERVHERENDNNMFSSEKTKYQVYCNGCVPDIFPSIDF